MTTSQAIVSREVLHFMSARGLTQAALADAIGLTQPKVSARLRGSTRWSLDDIDALGRIGVPVSLASFVLMEV